MEPVSPKEVAVVGGGLGGLAAALAVASAELPGVHVTVYESADRLGGMAGASKRDEDFEDHGYHIFPPWYLNIYGIIERLGIRSNLHDITRFHQLRQGEFPRFRTLENFTSFQYAWRNLISGAIPFADLVLYYYSVIDLLCQRYSKRGFLDQISMIGFVRSRFYRTEAVAKQYQDLLLKFISVPSYRVSAMTVQKMLSLWVANSVPMHRILNSDMHRGFIGPWEDKLRQMGCTIAKGKRLTKVNVSGSRVTKIEIRAPDGATETRNVDSLVMALPPRAVVSLLDDDLYDADPSLFNMNYLGSEAMASLSLYFKSKVPLPAEHVNLLDSRFALTFIDVSQHWNLSGVTVLNVIASDVNELRGVSDEHAVKEIVKELCRYLPVLKPEDIQHVFYQPHYTEPLVTNDVGAWAFRPKAKAGLQNLYLAGSHCRNFIDMTSMEGAVTSGLTAGNSLIKDYGSNSLWEIHEQKRIHPLYFHFGRMIGFPFAAICKAWVMMTGKT